MPTGQHLTTEQLLRYFAQDMNESYYLRSILNTLTVDQRVRLSTVIKHDLDPAARLEQLRAVATDKQREIAIATAAATAWAQAAIWFSRLTPVSFFNAQYVVAAHMNAAEVAAACPADLRVMTENLATKWRKGEVAS
jgi:hypothetical protein